MDRKYQHILEAWPKDRTGLIPALLKVQEKENCISAEAVREIGLHVGVTDNEVFSLASFYPRFRLIPSSGPRMDPNLNGPPLFGQPGETTDLPPIDRQVRVALRNCGSIDPEDINTYIARGGYGGLARALRMRPEDVEEEVRRSGLREENGSGLSLPAGWRVCREAPGKEKYVIGQGTVIDPQALTEVTLLESDPHAVLEGLLIAAYASGASRGIMVVDSGLPSAGSRLEKAFRQIADSPYLGDRILGSDFSFQIQISPVPGPLSCGDPAQVLPALEGRRPTACGRSNFSTASGFLGFPTVCQGVETLARLSGILERGADWYRGLGLNGCAGTKTCTLIGAIKRAGLIEVPWGTSLRTIINDIGGGLPGEGKMKALQVGGPLGGWLPASELDILVAPDTLIAAGITLGSGTLNVSDQTACAVDLARKALEFAREESCGQCLFCREGTRQMEEILTDITEGRSRPEDLDLLLDLGEGLKLGSSCSLGRTAPDAFLTTFRHFPEEYETHIREKRCRAGVCRPLSGGTSERVGLVGKR
ncbi:MAG: NAD(P)H-dependent oxidoreductase subunit E [Deltaproteobacteria bacterium]|nr:NAD(P)H-dependent oxidoreductase subunit E [Deltaproteobacteria bacterium]